MSHLKRSSILIVLLIGFTKVAYGQSYFKCEVFSPSSEILAYTEVALPADEIAIEGKENDFNFRFQTNLKSASGYLEAYDENYLLVREERNFKGVFNPKTHQFFIQMEGGLRLLCQSFKGPKWAQ